MIFLLHFAAILVLGFGLSAASFRLLRRLEVPAGVRPALAWALVALAGYGAFWAFFASPVLGRICTGGILVALLVYGWRERRSIAADWRDSPDWRGTSGLIVGCGLAYGAILHLWPSAEPSDTLVNMRFIVRMPPDNELPRMFADRLEAGESPRRILEGWQSSDRPPLQAGFILLLRPWLSTLGADPRETATAAGLLFQLLWIPGLWAFLRTLPARVSETWIVVLGTSVTGFALFHSLYTWPKLGAVGLLLTGISLLSSPPGARLFTSGALIGLCFALSYLSHGGVAFSLIALAPFLWWSRFSPRWRRFFAIGLTGAIVFMPWMLYQRYYEPPGDRLLKWHLAGAEEEGDSRTFVQALRDNYGALGWAGAWEYRKANLRALGFNFTHLGREWVPFQVAKKRADEFFYFFRGLGLGTWLLLLSPWLLWRWRQRDPAAHGPASAAILLHLLWVLLTLAVWIVLMYGPWTTFIHQGSLAPLVLAWALPTLVLLRWRPGLLAAALALQAGFFVFTWLSPSYPQTHQLAAGPAIVLALSTWVLLSRCLRVFLEAFPAKGRMEPSRGFRASLHVAAAAVTLAGGVALCYPPAPRGLPPVEGLAHVWVDGNFVTRGTYPSVDHDALPHGLDTRGSWQGTDADEGEAVTFWLRPQTDAPLTIPVSGYPSMPGNALSVEIRDVHGAITRVPFTESNPGETWRNWVVPLPPGTEAARLRAVDQRREFRGWLAFGHPMQLPRWKFFPLALALSLTALGILLTRGFRPVRPAPACLS